MRKFCLILFTNLLPSIYSILTENVESLGCWKDSKNRTLPSLENKHHFLTGKYLERKNAIEKCAKVAIDHGYTVFGLQDGGKCLGGKNGEKRFNLYGPSNLCRDGRGGRWSNNIYSTKTFHSRSFQSSSDETTPWDAYCSRPLDIMLLLDGSGPINKQTKRRWNNMKNFVKLFSKGFDDHTRIGVIDYGGGPEIIKDLKKQYTKEKTDLILEKAEMPGGERSLNDGLKRAWREQLKETNRTNADKIILAMTAGDVPYGLYGSSQFLSDHNVRVVVLGVDKNVHYEFLQSVASYRDVGNIFSVNSEQLADVAPYIYRDICNNMPEYVSATPPTPSKERPPEPSISESKNEKPKSNENDTKSDNKKDIERLKGNSKTDEKSETSNGKKNSTAAAKGRGQIPPIVRTNYYTAAGFDSMPTAKRNVLPKAGNSKNNAAVKKQLITSVKKGATKEEVATMVLINPSPDANLGLTPMEAKEIEGRREIQRNNSIRMDAVKISNKTQGNNQNKSEDTTATRSDAHSVNPNLGNKRENSDMEKMNMNIKNKNNEDNVVNVSNGKMMMERNTSLNNDHENYTNDSNVVAFEQENYLEDLTRNASNDREEENEWEDDTPEIRNDSVEKINTFKNPDADEEIINGNSNKDLMNQKSNKIKESKEETMKRLKLSADRLSGKKSLDKERKQNKTRNIGESVSVRNKSGNNLEAPSKLTEFPLHVKGVQNENIAVKVFESQGHEAPDKISKNSFLTQNASETLDSFDSKAKKAADSKINGVGAVSQTLELHAGNGKEHVSSHPSIHDNHQSIFSEGRLKDRMKGSKSMFAGRDEIQQGLEHNEIKPIKKLDPNKFRTFRNVTSLLNSAGKDLADIYEKIHNVEKTNLEIPFKKEGVFNAFLDGKVNGKQINNFIEKDNSVVLKKLNNNLPRTDLGVSVFDIDTADNKEKMTPNNIEKAMPNSKASSFISKMIQISGDDNDGSTEINNQLARKVQTASNTTGRFSKKPQPAKNITDRITNKVHPIGNVINNHSVDKNNMIYLNRSHLPSTSHISREFINNRVLVNPSPSDGRFNTEDYHLTSSNFPTDWSVTNSKGMKAHELTNVNGDALTIISKFQKTPITKSNVFRYDLKKKFPAIVNAIGILAAKEEDAQIKKSLFEKKNFYTNETQIGSDYNEGLGIESQADLFYYVENGQRSKYDTKTAKNGTNSFLTHDKKINYTAIMNKTLQNKKVINDQTFLRQNYYPLRQINNNTVKFIKTIKPYRNIDQNFNFKPNFLQKENLITSLNLKKNKNNQATVINAVKPNQGALQQQKFFKNDTVIKLNKIKNKNKVNNNSKFFPINRNLHQQKTKVDKKTLHETSINTLHDLDDSEENNVVRGNIHIDGTTVNFITEEINRTKTNIENNTRQFIPSVFTNEKTTLDPVAPTERTLLQDSGMNPGLFSHTHKILRTPSVVKVIENDEKENGIENLRFNTSINDNSNFISVLKPVKVRNSTINEHIKSTNNKININNMLIKEYNNKLENLLNNKNYNNHKEKPMFRAKSGNNSHKTKNNQEKYADYNKNTVKYNDKNKNTSNNNVKKIQNSKPSRIQEKTGNNKNENTSLTARTKNKFLTGSNLDKNLEKNLKISDKKIQKVKALLNSFEKHIEKVVASNDTSSTNSEDVPNIDAIVTSAENETFHNENVVSPISAFNAHIPYFPYSVPIAKTGAIRKKVPKEKTTKANKEKKIKAKKMSQLNGDKLARKKENTVVESKVNAKNSKEDSKKPTIKKEKTEEVKKEGEKISKFGTSNDENTLIKDFDANIQEYNHNILDKISVLVNSMKPVMNAHVDFSSQTKEFEYKNKDLKYKKDDFSTPNPHHPTSPPRTTVPKTTISTTSTTTVFQVQFDYVYNPANGTGSLLPHASTTAGTGAGKEKGGGPPGGFVINNVNGNLTQINNNNHFNNLSSPNIAIPSSEGKVIVTGNYENPSSEEKSTAASNPKESGKTSESETTMPTVKKNLQSTASSKVAPDTLNTTKSTNNTKLSWFMHNYGQHVKGPSIGINATDFIHPIGQMIKRFSNKNIDILHENNNSPTELVYPVNQMIRKFLRGNGDIHQEIDIREPNLNDAVGEYEQVVEHINTFPVGKGMGVPFQPSNDVEHITTQPLHRVSNNSVDVAFDNVQPFQSSAVHINPDRLNTHIHTHHVAFHTPVSITEHSATQLPPQNIANTNVLFNSNRLLNLNRPVNLNHLAGGSIKPETNHYTGANHIAETNHLMVSDKVVDTNHLVGINHHELDADMDSNHHLLNPDLVNNHNVDIQGENYHIPIADAFNCDKFKQSNCSIGDLNHAHRPTNETGLEIEEQKNGDSHIETQGEALSDLVKRPVHLHKPFVLDKISFDEPKLIAHHQQLGYGIHENSVETSTQDSMTHHGLLNTIDTHLKPQTVSGKMLSEGNVRVETLSDNEGKIIVTEPEPETADNDPDEWYHIHVSKNNNDQKPVIGSALFQPNGVHNVGLQHGITVNQINTLQHATPSENGVTFSDNNEKTVHHFPETDQQNTATTQEIRPIKTITSEDHPVDNHEMLYETNELNSGKFHQPKVQKPELIYHKPHHKLLLKTSQQNTPEFLHDPNQHKEPKTVANEDEHSLELLHQSDQHHTDFSNTESQHSPEQLHQLRLQNSKLLHQSSKHNPELIHEEMINEPELLHKESEKDSELLHQESQHSPFLHEQKEKNSVSSHEEDNHTPEMLHHEKLHPPNEESHRIINYHKINEYSLANKSAEHLDHSDKENEHLISQVHEHEHEDGGLHEHYKHQEDQSAIEKVMHKLHKPHESKLVHDALDKIEHTKLKFDYLGMNTLERKNQMNELNSDDQAITRSQLNRHHMSHKRIMLNKNRPKHHFRARKANKRMRSPKLPKAPNVVDMRPMPNFLAITHHAKARLNRPIYPHLTPAAAPDSTDIVKHVKKHSVDNRLNKRVFDNKRWAAMQISHQNVDGKTLQGRERDVRLFGETEEEEKVKLPVINVDHVWTENTFAPKKGVALVRSNKTLFLYENPHKEKNSVTKTLQKLLWINALAGRKDDTDIKFHRRTNEKTNNSGFKAYLLHELENYEQNAERQESGEQTGSSKHIIAHASSKIPQRIKYEFQQPKSSNITKKSVWIYKPGGPFDENNVYHYNDPDDEDFVPTASHKNFFRLQNVNPSKKQHIMAPTMKTNEYDIMNLGEKSALPNNIIDENATDNTDLMGANNAEKRNSQHKGRTTVKSTTSKSTTKRIMTMKEFPHTFLIKDFNLADLPSLPAGKSYVLATPSIGTVTVKIKIDDEHETDEGEESSKSKKYHSTKTSSEEPNEHETKSKHETQKDVETESNLKPEVYLNEKNHLVEVPTDVLYSKPKEFEEAPSIEKPENDAKIIQNNNLMEYGENPPSLHQKTKSTTRKYNEQSEKNNETYSKITTEAFIKRFKENETLSDDAELSEMVHAVVKNIANESKAFMVNFANETSGDNNIFSDKDKMQNKAGSNATDLTNDQVKDISSTSKNKTNKELGDEAVKTNKDKKLQNDTIIIEPANTSKINITEELSKNFSEPMKENILRDFTETKEEVKKHLRNASEDISVTMKENILHDSSYKLRPHNASDDISVTMKMSNVSMVTPDATPGDDRTSISKENNNTAIQKLNPIEYMLGCNKPLRILYAIDVSDGLGEGGIRKKRWNRLKDFITNINNEVIKGVTSNFMVYNIEPRFMDNIDGCDKETEYFLTSDDCLCSMNPVTRSTRAGCSVNGPTQLENVEDWGQIGPRTGKALDKARTIYFKDNLSKYKNIIFLISHKQATDDLKTAEMNLKKDGISLVDIELGDRHDLRKRHHIYRKKTYRRSHIEEAGIPDEHKVKVSLKKLQQTLRNIVGKVCKSQTEEEK